MSGFAVRVALPFILASMLAAAVLGFSVMDEPGHAMMGCFGSASGKDCPMLSPIEHFAAHLRAFRDISTGVAQSLFLFLAAILLFVFASAPRLRLDGYRPRYLVFKRREGFVSPRHILFKGWLALHQKREPSLACAVIK